MTSKVMILAAILWLVALVGGAVSGKVQEYLRIWQTPKGLLEMKKLARLYDGGGLGLIRRECIRAEADPGNLPLLPRILYIGWAAEKRAGNILEADRIQKEFLQRFPKHPLGAYMHLAIAINAFNERDKTTVRHEDDLIQSQYPTSPLITIVRNIDDGNLATNYTDATR